MRMILKKIKISFVLATALAAVTAGTAFAMPMPAGHCAPHTGAVHHPIPCAPVYGHPHHPVILPAPHPIHHPVIVPRPHHPIHHPVIVPAPYPPMHY